MAGNTHHLQKSVHKMHFVRFHPAWYPKPLLRDSWRCSERKQCTPSDCQIARVFQVLHCQHEPMHSCLLHSTIPSQAAASMPNFSQLQNERMTAAQPWILLRATDRVWSFPLSTARRVPESFCAPRNQSAASLHIIGARVPCCGAIVCRATTVIRLIRASCQRACHCVQC